MTMVHTACLGSMQNWFLDVITHPQSAEAGVESRQSFVASSQLDHVVQPARTETSLERLEIYRQSYFNRLQECLADDYPALKFTLGDEVFRELCCAYVLEHPSHEPSLNSFGRHMPEFVRRRLHEHGQFASELAQLEWALVEVLHAPAPHPLSAQTLSGISPSQLPVLRFLPSSALRLFVFDYPVNAYLQCYFEEKRPEIVGPQKSFVAVVRQGHALWRLDLNHVQATLLERLVAGVTLGAALSGIDASAAEVQTWFSEWTQHGFFAGIDATGTP